MRLIEILGERIIESPFMRNSSGRARVLADMAIKIENGGEVSPEDEERIGLMPSGWQETLRFSIESFRVARDRHLV